MDNKEIYLLGVGHATPIFIELAEVCGYHVAGLYHYNSERTCETDHGYTILGSFDEMLQADISGKNFCLTMGDMDTKQSISQLIMNIGGTIPTLIHPTAIVSRFANVSSMGVLICSSCEVHNDARIDEGCVLWPQAMVDHDSHLSPYTFMGPKAYVGAYTEVGSQVFIGQCSVLISAKAKSIGNRALIGAGSVVTKFIPDEAVVAGNPARIIKYRK